MCFDLFQTHRIRRQGKGRGKGKGSKHKSYSNVTFWAWHAGHCVKLS